MTYRQRGMGLGAGTVASAPSSALTVQAQTPAFRPLISPNVAAQLSTMPQQAASMKAASPPPALSIVPSWCSGVEAPNPTAESPGAGQVAVLAYPFVKFSDTQIQSILNNIYGTGAGGAGLITGTAAAQAQNIVPAPPIFVASGWMPDPGAPTKMTRGTLWLAFGWSTAVTVPVLVKYAAAVMAASSGVDPTGGIGGSYNSNAEGGKLIGPGLIPKIAAGTSDEQLQNAAIASATGTLYGLTVLATVLTGGGAGPLAAINTMPAAAVDLITKASQVHAAVTAGPQLAAMLSQVPALATQLARATPDTCAQAVAQADQARAALTQAVMYINGGLGVARAIGDAASVEAQPGGGAIADAIRTQIQAAANASGQTGAAQLLVSRASLQCSYFQTAQRTYDASLKTVASAIDGATADAQTLLANAPQLQASLAQVDGAMAQLDAAKQQSCLSWWLKNWHGMPVVYWMGGGGTLVLGGALLLRARRHKRAAAAKAATATPNRRRTSRRRRSR